MKIKILLVLCLFTAAAHAQFVTNNKRVGDVYFHNGAYYAAAEYYKKALNLTADSSGSLVLPYGFENRVKQDSPKRDEYENTVFQLAEALRLYKNFAEAEKWYATVIGFNKPRFILSYFWYGETLRANQKMPEAIKAFNEFLSKYDVNDNYKVKAKQEIASCRFALYEIKFPRLFKTNRLQNNINDKGSNYAGLLQTGTFYFTSSRPTGTSGKKEILQDKANAKVTREESPFVNAIYEASGNPLTDRISVKKLAIKAKERELGAAAFLPNGKVMYVTNWSNEGTKRIVRLNATSTDKGSAWSEPVDLGGNINVNGFNAMQPFVTKDGKYLIFSSDRPGGYGKYDLWYAAIESDGTVGLATNMGETVNTDEDDQAPYYNNSTKKLLFSSNGRIGMGGFDFYESEGDFVTWTAPRNLGYPFNSSKDDMYFTATETDDSAGYISSDRDSQCCLEIFYVKKQSLVIQGLILDCNTQKPLSGVLVTLADSLQDFKVTTDETGRYSFKVNSNRHFKLTADKEKYFSKAIAFNYNQMVQRDTLTSPDLCLIPYEIDKPIVLKDVLYEFNKADLTEDSKEKLDHLYDIMVDNPSIEIELSAHTDSKGGDEYNLDLSNRRAKSCVDYLIEKGVSSTRMTSKGYGKTRPVAPNTFPNGKDNPEGRALNRRTEFKVTKK
jgi:OOP family OmpA-OmpF porin